MSPFAHLLKLLYPDPEMPISDVDLEWTVRLALGCRRRGGAAEAHRRGRVPQHPLQLVLGLDGVEKFVSTPELISESSIGADPLEPGQVWSSAPAGPDEAAGLYRIEATDGPGSGVKILNRRPPPFVESVKYAEQNLYARTRELVGDRDPRGHEFSLQLRAFDASKAGARSAWAS